MAIEIIDGGGRGNSARINSVGQLLVQSTSRPIQHAQSMDEGRAYQVQGDFASVNNSTFTILHIKNTSTTRLVVVTYIRLQFLDFAGGTTVPNVATYWTLGFGQTFASGGTAVTPVNVNRASGNVSSVTGYDNNPTLAGTFVEIDRHYVKEEAENITYNKEGAVILGLNDTFMAKITSDHTSGVAYARFSYFEIDRDKVT